MNTAARLTVWLATREVRAFNWPFNNCCHFAAKWVREYTGRELKVPPVGNARDAKTLLRSWGGSLEAACTRAIGTEPIPATLAQTGDLVLLDAVTYGIGAAIGICTGRDAVFIDADGDAVFVPMAQASCAWRLA